ncbi:phosphoric monoester hydrolase [Alcanivorax hongdengensis A-11-3]|uniref:Probable 2-phosphosulfolactate phosphatase n=1 Tax=Alcanivorax hongdengensis A-11-3 TaxID=1177179 RepID=L0WJT0_9GAMM|nr:2-phosphosulfolactate phosphatase [Alcanivorax hongdengensis]EKF76095.1 phosphoric monoester hydrolase [Alcanivorax hongdengensis A-11-3]
MQIHIAQGHNPPHNIHGITVVIDVIRAFTTSHHAFRGGLRCIWPVATAEQAFALRDEHCPEALLAGEVEALPIDGFDFGNSPWEIDQAELQGREMILRTTNGVAATLRARDSQQVLVAGLVNARATAHYLREQNPPCVVLVASHPTGDEDVACAEYIRGLLGGDGISYDAARQRTLNARAARKFYDGRHPRLRAQDIEAAASDGGDNALVMAVSFEPRPCIRPLPR